MTASWCRIELDGKPAFGLVEGGDIAIVDAPPYEAHRRTGRKVAFKDAKLLPPVMPYNFYAAGINFREHIEWANQRLGMSLKPPTQADIGYRSPNALVGSGADIVIPKDSQGPIHFEGELVAVVGKRRSISPRRTRFRALPAIRSATISPSALSRRPTAPYGGRRTSTRSSPWARSSCPAWTRRRRRSPCA